MVLPITLQIGNTSKTKEDFENFFKNVNYNFRSTLQTFTGNKTKPKKDIDLLGARENKIEQIVLN